jgi:peptide/nickel transport system substrate-binding protein
MFHDGTPITAKDVKWSFDRAVTVGGFPTFQMAAGSLQKPEQFVAVDDYTFRVDFLRADKLTMPDIGVPVPVIMNSELCKKNATEKDPWAMEWCKNNHASGGAYKVEKWQPSQEVIFVRNDDWKNGPLPKVQARHPAHHPVGRQPARAARARRRRPVVRPAVRRTSPSSRARQAHRDRHADRERDDLCRHERHQKPFDNVKLRQAVAWACPTSRSWTR